MIYYSVDGNLWYVWQQGKHPKYYVPQSRLARRIEQFPGELYNSNLDDYKFQYKLAIRQFLPITLRAVLKKHHNEHIHPDTLRILLKELAQ